MGLGLVKRLFNPMGAPSSSSYIITGELGWKTFLQIPINIWEELIPYLN
jgi:hypothetical protein